jgi:hypothetical protein
MTIDDGGAACRAKALAARKGPGTSRHVLDAIEDKRDVEDLVDGLLFEEADG